MAALLAVLTFVLFATLDYLLSRGKRARQATAAVLPAPPEETPVPEPVWVAGYSLPEQLHYHPGHTWARVEAPDTVTVGIDDFGRRLIGKPSKVRTPAVGSWLRQGARQLRVETDGRTADIVSPVEGEVVAVNHELRSRPELCAEDPYGRGWFCKVRSANLAANLRNLLRGGLARRWTEDSRDQLELQLMALSGSVLQDGGEPAPDYAERLEADDWKRLVRRFLLT